LIALLAAGLLQSSAVQAEGEKVDSSHYTHAIVYKAATDKKLKWLQLLRLGDDCEITDRSNTPYTTSTIEIDAFKKLWDGIQTIDDFHRGELEDLTKKPDLATAHFIVTYQRTKATGRHENTHIFMIPLDRSTKEFQTWLSKLQKLKEGEQKRAVQPATLPSVERPVKDQPSTPTSKVTPR
jgi:hypothetical protein